MFSKENLRKIPKAAVLPLFVFLGIVFFVTPGLAAWDGSSREDTTLETITVTAQKREENMQEVPVSISTLSEFAIEDAGIQSTLDIHDYVPNLFTTYGGPRGYVSRITVRGISNTGLGDPAVALYIDDVPCSDIYIFNQPIFDLERIEVLKGPQGTLYGKNTEGGAINIITKQPGNERNVKVGMELGNFDKRQIHANVDLPLVKDELFFRVFALGNKRDGYMENMVTGNGIDDQETKIIRAGLVYTPSSRWDIAANISFTDMDDGGTPMGIMEPSRYEAFTGLRTGKFEIGEDRPGTSKSQYLLSSFKVRYKADLFDILSVSGFRDNDNELKLDGDATPMPILINFNTNDGTAFTQEMRILSKPEHPGMNWIMGVFYSDDDKDVSTGFITDTGAGAMDMPVGAKNSMAAALTGRDAAVFGQIGFRFLDEALGMTAGLRYDWSERSMDRTHTFGGVPVAPDIKREKSYNELLPRFSVDYKFSKDMMLYGSYARGYKAGGFSYAVDNPDLAAYKPEINNAFELGLKSEFPGIGLRLNLAAFYNLVDDYQDRVEIDAYTIMQANAASMTSRGIELESVCHFAPDWFLELNAGYLDARYDDYPDTFHNTNYDGNKVALVPEYSISSALQYRNSFGFMGRFECLHTGKRYMDRANAKEVPAYTVLNMKLGYETEHWDVYISAKNLTNKEYFLDGYENPMLGWMGTIGAPRTFGVTFNYRF